MTQTAPSRFPQASHTRGPVTEREAEREVTESGDRQTHLTAVIETVRLYPGLPASSIARQLNMDVVEVRRRLTDGFKMGELVQGAPIRMPGEKRQVTWFPARGTVQGRMFE